MESPDCIGSVDSFWVCWGLFEALGRGVVRSLNAGWRMVSGGESMELRRPVWGSGCQLVWKQVMEESSYLMCVVYNEREQTRCPFERKERRLMHDFRVYGRMELVKKRILGRSSLMKKIVIGSSVLE